MLNMNDHRQQEEVHGPPPKFHSETRSMTPPGGSLLLLPRPSGLMNTSSCCYRDLLGREAFPSLSVFSLFKSEVILLY